MAAATEGSKRKRSQTASTVSDAQQVVSSQVDPGVRRQEILEYLKLFGYKPDRTILQVHIAGFFNKKRASARQVQKREATAKRYGGTTFVVVGRTHDPSIMEQVIRPRKKQDEASPGYLGYLWKNKDPQNRAPHEVIPLDFTPSNVSYPDDWKNMFATKAFMIALHVPASFAKHKNRLSRALYHACKGVSAKDRWWSFIDKVRSSGYEETMMMAQQQRAEQDDPLNILKLRLAKGEISQEEYRQLLKTLTA